MSGQTNLIRRTVCTGRRGCRRSGQHARAAVLLEVVISLGILLMAISVVGLIFRNGQRNVETAERLTRAMMMTERLIVEMDTSLLDWEEREQSGWFGDESVPGMSWRVEVSPHDRIDELLEVDLHIYMGDPDGPEEERQRILTTHILRAEPKGIDFEKDFGLEAEQIDELAGMIPGGEGAFDPENFDPRTLAGLDMETLMEMLPELMPALMQLLGGNLGGANLDDLMQAVEGADPGALQDLAGAAGAGAGSDSPDAGGGRGSAGGRRSGGRREGGTRSGIGTRRGGGGR